MKVAIAYFSRADENYLPEGKKYIEKGFTEIFAEIIESKTKGDLVKIELEVPYAASYDECVIEAVKDFKSNNRPAIKDVSFDVNDYDLIYLGFPNYCGTMPMPVWTFLEKYNFEGKTIKPFCTHEGSGFSRSLNDLEKLCPSSLLVEGLAIKGSQVEKSKEIIEKWIG